MVIITLGVEKFEGSRLFLLDKSHKVQNYYKVNIVKQQKNFLVHIKLMT